MTSNKHDFLSLKQSHKIQKAISVRTQKHGIVPLVVDSALKLFLGGISALKLKGPFWFKSAERDK